jgi:hypothetical protein
VRVDATHYPGEYAAKTYDPRIAQTIYAEVIEGCASLRLSIRVRCNRRSRSGSARNPGTVENVGRPGHNLASRAFPDGGRLSRFIDGAQKAGRKVSGANFLVLAPLFVAPTDAEAEKIVNGVTTQMRPFALERCGRSCGCTCKPDR